MSHSPARIWSSHDNTVAGTVRLTVRQLAQASCRVRAVSQSATNCDVNGTAAEVADAWRHHALNADGASATAGETGKITGWYVQYISRYHRA